MFYLTFNSFLIKSSKNILLIIKKALQKNNVGKSQNVSNFFNIFEFFSPYTMCT